MNLDFIPLLSSLNDVVAREIVDIFVPKSAHGPFSDQQMVAGGRGPYLPTAIHTGDFHNCLLIPCEDA